jgi:hypothetical protein
MAQHTRALGDEERLFNTIKVTVVIIADVSGPLLFEDVKNASYMLAKRHPMLRTDISQDNEHWVPLSLDQVQGQLKIRNITTLDANEWQQLAMEYCNTPIEKKQGKPFWHVTFIKYENEQKILITYDHSISDGIGGKLMIRDLLQFCDRIRNEGLTIEDVESLPMLNDLTHLVFPHVTEEIKEAAQKKASQIMQTRLKTVPLIPFEISEGKRRNNAIFFEGKNFAMIKQAAKERSLTVGNILLAATYFEIAKIYFAQHNESSIRIPIDLDVNMRPRVIPSLDNEHVACLMEMIQLDVLITRQTGFWQLCSEINAKMNQLLEEKDPHITVLANELVPMDQEYENHLERNQGRFSDVNLSNMGLFTPNVIGAFTVNKLFTVSTHCPEGWNFMFFIHCVNNLCYSFEYEETLLKRETVHQIGINIINLIEHCHEISTGGLQ